MQKQLGLLIGAAVLSIITTAYHLLFTRALLNDGLYFIVWIFVPIPIGAILGVAAAHSRSLLAKKPLAAGGTLLAGVMLATIPLCNRILMALSQPSSAGASTSSVVTGTLGFYAPPVIWLAAHFIAALGIIIWGLLKADVFCNLDTA